MPLAFIQLDTTYPPTWEATWGRTPAYAGDPGTPVVDPDTAVEFITGEDKVNYFTSQRYQGDLFKRDVIINNAIRSIIDYLSTRTGPVLSLPDTTLWPNSFLTLGHLRFTAAQNPSGAYVVGGLVRRVSGAADEDCVMRIVDMSDASVLATVASSTFGSTAIWLADPTTARSGVVMAHTNEYEVRLYNLHATQALVASAALAFQARTTG